jgi:hypothetical protein
VIAEGGRPARPDRAGSTWPTWPLGSTAGRRGARRWARSTAAHARSRDSRGLRVLEVAVSHTTAVHPPADQRNLELLLARLPVPFLGELPYGATRLRGLDLAALLTSAGSA